MPGTTLRRCLLVLAASCLAGCGVASNSPVIRDADLTHDPRLVGTWTFEEDTAVITTTGAGRYDVRLVEGRKLGRFEGRLGRVGPYRVLDLQPSEPLPDASDTYRSLLLRAHGFVVLDSIGDVVRMRMLVPDSLKFHLQRDPAATPHALLENSVLLTGSSGDAWRFLSTYLGRPGVLDTAMTWTRRVR